MKLSSICLLFFLPASSSSWTAPASAAITAKVGFEKRRAALFMAPNGAHDDDGSTTSSSNSPFQLKHEELVAGDIDEATFTADMMKQLEALEAQVEKLPKRPEGLAEKKPIFSKQGVPFRKQTTETSSLELSEALSKLMPPKISGKKGDVERAFSQAKALFEKTKVVARDSIDMLQTQLNTTTVSKTGDTYQEALGKVGKAGQGIGKLLMDACQDATQAVVEQAKKVDLPSKVDFQKMDLQGAAEKIKALGKESADKMKALPMPSFGKKATASESTVTPQDNPIVESISQPHAKLPTNIDLQGVADQVKNQFAKVDLQAAAEKMKSLSMPSFLQNNSIGNIPTTTTTPPNGEDEENN